MLKTWRSRITYDTPELNTSLYLQRLGISNFDFLDKVVYSEVILLFAESNLFTRLPAHSMETFPKLQVLNLCSNAITCIDFTVLGPQLRELHVSDNLISKMTGNCRSPLKILKINKNKLLDISNFRNMVPELEVLDLSENQIENASVADKLPVGLVQLYLFGNPFVGKVKEYRCETIRKFPSLTYLDKCFVDRALAETLKPCLGEFHRQRLADRREKMVQEVLQMKLNQVSLV